MLANIYLHFTVDEPFHKDYGFDERAKMVRYADDLMILTRTKQRCLQTSKHLEGWLGASGLKASKAKLLDMAAANRGYESKFDFLGFKFLLRSFKDNPKRFWVVRQPSESSRQRLGLAIRERLHVGMGLIEAYWKLEETWHGWCEYFSSIQMPTASFTVQERTLSESTSGGGSESSDARRRACHGEYLESGSRK